jgi:hypothetical protein
MVRRSHPRPLGDGAENALRVTVTIRHANPLSVTELRDRQLRALVQLLQRAAALQAEARRAA